MVNGLNGQQMLIGLLIGIVLLIFMVLKTKIQAFLALIITTVVIGVIGGMPLNTITLDNGTKFGILQSITSGFGNTLSSIGIIIGFGVMLGAIFEETGAAKRMALCFLKVFGKNKEEEAMAFTGFLVSIPIFCDSGFIILSPIAKAISKVTKKSLISLGVALAAGLVITHTMVPPTPGPLGVCGIFGIDVGEFILLALVLSIPMTIVAIIYARKYIAKKLNWIVNEKDEIVPAPVGTVASDDAINLDEKDLPSTFSSFLPILLPVVLILINTVSTATKMTGGIFTILIFLGQPIVAVGIGLLTAIFVLGRKMSRKEILLYGAGHDVRRDYHVGNRRWRSTGTDYQRFRSGYLYGRGNYGNACSHYPASYPDFYSNAFYPGFRYCSDDYGSQHFRADYPCFRSKSGSLRSGLLRRILLLQLL